MTASLYQSISVSDAPEAIKEKVTEEDPQDIATTDVKVVDAKVTKKPFPVIDRVSMAGNQLDIKPLPVKIAGHPTGAMVSLS